MSDQTGQTDGLNLDELREELSDLGRALLDQAINSALRTKALRAEIARLTNEPHQQ